MWELHEFATLQFDCNLCGQASFSFHMPKNSSRGLVVSKCDTCRFLQGNLVDDFVLGDSAKPSNYLSCDSDYAAIRVGKAQMLGSHSDFLRKHLATLSPGSRVLDVAAGWGDFARLVVEEFPEFELRLEEHSTAMYRHLLELSKDHDRITVAMSGEENASLPEEFDFIYATHSLEHFRNPRKTMRRWKSLLRHGGILFVDVPDVQKIDLKTVVEDHFYDEHLSYFSEQHLCNLGLSTGFSIGEIYHYGGSVVVAMVAESIGEAVEWPVLSVGIDLVSYPQRLEENRSALPGRVSAIHQKIAQHDGEALAIGCGRRFDAFRVYGEMDLSLFDFFVDTFLSRVLNDFHGRKIWALADTPAFCLRDPLFVVFAGSSADNLVRSIVGFGFGEAQFMSA